MRLKIVENGESEREAYIESPYDTFLDRGFAWEWFGGSGLQRGQDRTFCLLFGMSQCAI